MVAVDARLVFALQIDVALDPGAKVMRVASNIIFPLACLDATQAADALGGIDAEAPAVLGPVVVRGGKRTAALAGLGFRRYAPQATQCASNGTGIGHNAAKLLEELAPRSERGIA